MKNYKLFKEETAMKMKNTRSGGGGMGGEGGNGGGGGGGGK